LDFLAATSTIPRSTSIKKLSNSHSMSILPFTGRNVSSRKRSSTTMELMGLLMHSSISLQNRSTKSCSTLEMPIP
jgi:hypothetical protein